MSLFNEAARKDLQATDSPVSLWDYCTERRSRINNMAARGMRKLRGSKPHVMLCGKEGDISNLFQFDWHRWYYHMDNNNNSGFLHPPGNLERVLRLAKGTGNEMC